MAHYDLPGNWDDLVDDYLKSLCKLPPDLLDRALTHVLETYPYRFPKIANIMKAVEAELSERTALVKRLETVVEISKWPEPPRVPPTQAEKDAVHELVERAKKTGFGVSG